MWKHPKYYKELRKLRNKLDQAISPMSDGSPRRRATGPGPKQQAIEETVPHNDIEEAQASSAKLTDPQATSDKHQAPRHKRQA
jgi:hypothetical protein